MKYLFLLFLLLSCTPRGVDKYVLDAEKCGPLCQQEKAYVEAINKAELKGPKYTVPNEFTLTNGCKVRVTKTPEAYVIFDVKGNYIGRYQYKFDIILNEWSNNCSSMDNDTFDEREIVKARYK